MEFERFISGVGAGIVSAAITKSVNFKEAQKRGEVMETALTDASIVTVCVAASVYLDMPFLVPVILSTVVRAGHESEKFLIWLHSHFKGGDDQ